jgi:two-component system phosphate regulon sensor histidine kinase PhoR
LHDVTELRRLENLRRDFVANVSHELKTPLSSIKAYTETLLGGALHDPEANVTFVRHIEEQAERLHQLILAAKVSQIEPTLQMSFPDPKWLESHLKENPKAIRHEQIDDRVLLTASTQELQEFVCKHAETPGAFGEPSNLKRTDIKKSK